MSETVRVLIPTLFCLSFLGCGVWSTWLGTARRSDGVLALGLLLFVIAALFGCYGVHLAGLGAAR